MGLAFKLEIDCANEAFGEDQFSACDEVARILEKVALELRAMRSAPTTLRDYNGNKVGTCQFTEA